MSFVTADNFFASVGYFAEGGAKACGLDSEVEEVAFFCAHALCDGSESFFYLSFVAVCLHFVETFDLLAANFGVVDLEDVDRIFMVETILVDAYDGLTT